MQMIAKLLCLICSFLMLAINVEASSETTATVVEGTLTQVSRLPAAANNPYPDCYYTAVLDIANIASGNSIPKRLVLVLPGFFGRQYSPEAGYKTGDKVRATVVPFASMPEKVRQAQQADDIEDVALPLYYPKEIARLADFTNLNKAIPFATASTKTGSIPEPEGVDVKAKAARHEAIQHDLDQIDKLLAEHGGDWNRWYDASRGYREQYKKQFDAKAQLWVNDTYFSAGYLDEGRIYSPDFVKSVIAFKNYLASHNVDLILVRVPQKGEIVDDVFTGMPRDAVSNPYVLKLYKDLLEADVEIVTDIIAKAKDERLNYSLMYWYQDFPEAHPAEGMSWVVAKELAKRVARYGRVASSPKMNLHLRKASPSTRSFRWPEGNPRFSSRDHVTFASVTDDKGKVVELKQGDDSPVIILGSSFIAYPSLDKGGSIPHYFAYLTGTIPDLMQRSGGDRTMYRNVVREGDDFLRGKTVCLFPFVPDIALSALASPPLVNLQKSVSTPLAYYSGTTIQQAFELSHETPKEAFFYSADGTLNIKPVSKDRGVEGKFSITLPKEVSRFPYFCVQIEFASFDTSYIVARYSGQIDATIKSNDQLKNEENFIFATKSGGAVDFTFQGNAKFVRPIVIKSVRILGVTSKGDLTSQKMMQ